MTNNKKKGYVLLWRSLFDNPLFDDGQPYDKRSAWCELIAMANHKSNTVEYNGGTIDIKRGQRLTSIRKLAKSWNWSENRVRRYLSLLERHNMIETNRTKGGTIITIVNYNTYNTLRHTDGDTDEYTDGSSNEYTGGSQTINESINDIKNEEKKGRRFPLYDNRGVLIEE